MQYESDVFNEQQPSVQYSNPIFDSFEPGPSQIDVHVDKTLAPVRYT